MLKMKFSKNYYCCTSGKNNPQNWKYTEPDFIIFSSFFSVVHIILVYDIYFIATCCQCKYMYVMYGYMYPEVEAELMAEHNAKGNIGIEST